MTNAPNLNDARSTALAAIVANVKRLLGDAETLQAGGSAGSALALAVLAFEEAGKGHIVEHGWEKPKHIRSHHSYRHMMAFQVLYASFTQKYAIDLRETHEKIAARLQDAGLKPGSGAPLPPLTAELREALRATLLPQLQSLSPDQIISFGIERRWLDKIAAAVSGGRLEKIRQSGLYLDTDGQFEITSSPLTIEKIDAERWIWAATRVLNLLEAGEYRQAYSPLAELLAAADDGDLEAKEALAIVREHASSTRAKRESSIDN